MPNGEIVTGLKQRWSLVKKLGEGDAGQVFLVEALLTREQGILKVPHSTSIASEVLRQSKQIQREGQILKVLQYLLGDEGKLAAPRILDHSDPDAGYGEGQMIVIEKAPGISLHGLARGIRTQDPAAVGLDGAAPVENQTIVTRLVETGKIPALMILQILLAVIELFEKIHFAEIIHAGQNQAGLIWNDVKSDHLFWDPAHQRLTIIDWGNSEFLDSSGVTRDRQHTRAADYTQFIEELGRFTEENSPELYAHLKWPRKVTPANAYSSGVKPLKKRILGLAEEQQTGLQELRSAEQALFAMRRPTLKHLEQLDQLQNKIMDYGEPPDYSAAAGFYFRVAARLIEEKEFTDFEKICELAARQPTAPRRHWAMLQDILANNKHLLPENLAQVLLFGIQGEWDAALWGLLMAHQEESLPLWWDDISRQARELQLNLDEEVQPPYVTASRVYYTLQATAMRQRENGRPGLANGINGAAGLPANGLEETLETLVRRFEEEIIRKWKEVEPAPPNASLDYLELERLLSDLEKALPGAQETLQKALAQPGAQIKIIQEAWGRKDFDQARRGLRRLLLWDPHRRRVLSAERALRAAPAWLARVRSGARSDEPFQDYLIQMELSGRDLRNQVGPARWLDVILKAFKGLRTGARSADLLMENPELLNEMPWLNEARGRETLHLPGDSVPEFESGRKLFPVPVTVRSQMETSLQSSDGIRLGPALDVWVAEAQGSSARVFLGTCTTAQGETELAVKLMRPDRVDYALPLFREEAHILSLLQDVPGVNRLLECGFFQFADGFEFADDKSGSPPHAVPGRILRYAAAEAQNYLSAMDARLGQGWIPYLGLELQNQDHNLLHFCDAGRTRGRFLPLRESLITAIQICDILQAAHERNIVYRDHKILHYYWNPARSGVYAIDWNIAKRYPQGLSTAERQFDLVQFGARALHHILTGRAAPGALPLGPNRPEEIESASHSYAVQWTYDDERLPNRVKEVLAAVLAGEYSHVRDLKRDLFQIYQQLAPSAETQRA